MTTRLTSGSTIPNSLYGLTAVCLAAAVWVLRMERAGVGEWLLALAVPALIAALTAVVLAKVGRGRGLVLFLSLLLHGFVAFSFGREGATWVPLAMIALYFPMVLWAWVLVARVADVDGTSRS